MRLRLAALALGLCLLSVSGVATVRAGQQRARGDRVRTLSGQAGDQAAALDAYFERARTIDLLLARNDAFARAYSRSAASRRRAYGEQNAAMGYLQHLYPGRIAESCFIDQRGAEASRVVAREPAPRSELSTDEASSPFFHATFALRRGQVYQARPYLSPDTHTWVIANSTLLPVGRGAGRAIVHFEISLDSFRRQAAQSTPAGARVQIVDADTRQLIVDTTRPRPLGAPVGRLDERRYAALAGGATAGTMTLRGQTAAFHRVPRRTGNANRWYVVVSAAHAAGASWWTALGPANAAMIAAALLLLAFALTSFRAHQRTLREAALCDELTGLPNRAVFRDRVRQAVLASGRAGAFAAVLMIDLDRFKEVNDTLGHH